MKSPRHLLAIALLATLLMTPRQAVAKDDPVSIDQCPAAVQTVIRQYSAHATLEGVALDKKAKSGGPPVYEAKFTAKNGERFELHIAPDGKVLELERKKPKI